ncbi:MAG: hypothetical protein WCH04_21540 [Gammaproteobacteria bacterium]
MSDTNRKNRTAGDWAQLIEEFTASGFTQSAFCEQHGINYHTFRHRYQRSPLFRGKRRGAPTESFTEVSLRTPEPTLSDRWRVRFGELCIECPACTPLDAIIELARGLGRAL